MPTAKPELIAFSQHNLGGVQSFYYNLLSNDTEGYFDKKWLLLEGKGHGGALPPAPFNLNETIIKFDPADKAQYAAGIEKAISNKRGVILANHRAELDAIQLYPKPDKVVFYMVHDHMYLPLAKEYIAVIDVLVTHNDELYKRLLKMFPLRKEVIFFLPYGINLSVQQRQPNLQGKLKIAFVGRLCIEKGIFDLLKVDERLKLNNLEVDWLIIGDGPEKANFESEAGKRDNISMKTLATTAEIFTELAQCDIYILPSVLDGTPVAMLEAMSAGLVPLIYRFNDGIKKVVTKDIGYIVEIGKINALARIIRKLNDDRELLEKKSANALHAARAHYNVTDRAADYYNLFKEFEHLKLQSKAAIDAERVEANKPITFFNKVVRHLKWRINNMLPKKGFNY